MHILGNIFQTIKDFSNTKEYTTWNGHEEVILPFRPYSMPIWELAQCLVHFLLYIHVFP
jgi:hypothetical protein